MYPKNLMPLMCRKAACTIVFSLIASASAAQSLEVTETDRLNTWLDAEFEEYLDFYPISRSRLGDKSQHDQVQDVSEEAMQARLEWRRQSVTEMRERFDPDQLTEEGKISYELWEFMLERAERGAEFRRHGYLFGRNGPQSGVPSQLISNHTVSEPGDLDAYTARIIGSAQLIRDYLERSRLAAADGIRAPWFDYERAIREAGNIISGAPFDSGEPSPLLADFQSKGSALVEQELISGRELQARESEFSAALIDALQPAYAEVVTWLSEDYEANVSDVAKGVWSLPNGAAFYNQALYQMTTLELTADEIHQTGLSEVARIHSEMEAIKEQVGFEGSLGEFFVHMREDDQFFFPNTDEGREAYLQNARDILTAMEARLPEYFGLLPRADLQVSRVEAYREQAGGAAHYRRGPPDGSRPGTFYAHLSDMRAVAGYLLESLAYHEGVPGHHMQIAIQQELTEIPRFRTYHGYTAFSEGWGLYAEFLAKDMGLYTDPYNDFGRLTGELWRAIRLVVDTGIHAMAWTEQQAIDYALQNSPRPAASVRSEVHRYFNNPAQATSYKIGMNKIIQLREQAQDALGDRFDYRTFHDQVIGSGPLPLAVLESKIERWIENQL